jgi:phosphohistidine phosphatase
MKTIYLLRHAKSTGKDTDMPDHDRPLAKRGENDIVTVAERLGQRDIRPALILSSTAVRALQTAKLFAGAVGYRLKSIRLRKALYEQESDKFLEVIAGIHQNFGSVMLVGHNPSLSDFATMLCGGFDKALPTGTVVSFEFDTNSWKSIQPGEGRLALYETPRKPKVGKPRKVSAKDLRKDLQREIEAKIGEVLENRDRKAMKKVRKPITKSSRKIAEKFLESTRRKKGS